ncbi:MAG: hypothetical protein HFP77_08550 [Methylococcales symbiont of Iophon sp. n. MRB-2018]|nr:MAG: hypothetical protein HFP77_08550 [Methylococcales symbiont of Iophon sp. n. MRB-2018]
MRLPTRDGGNAVRLSGTISADHQGWWKCSKIVGNNLCPRTRTNQKSRGFESLVLVLTF